MNLSRRRTTLRNVLTLVEGAFFLSLVGCDPYYVSSVNGLVGQSVRAEPFDSMFVGEWYDSTWEKVEWKMERLMDTETYFLTMFGSEGKKKHYTASVVKAGDLKLMDVQEAPIKGRPAGPHLLMKINRRKVVELTVGNIPSFQKKIAALGDGPLISYKTLTLQVPRNQYFLDHPGLLRTRPAVDAEGNAAGFLFDATPEELIEFFKAHGADEGLWADDERTVKLECKLNPGE